jgi:hypothetical protein
MYRESAAQQTREFPYLLLGLLPKPESRDSRHVPLRINQQTRVEIRRLSDAGGHRIVGAHSHLLGAPEDEEAGGMVAVLEHQLPAHGAL